MALDKAAAPTLQQVLQRLEQLENRNLELERQLKALQSGTVATTPQAAASGAGWGDARQLDALAREHKALAQRVDDLSRQGDLQQADDAPGADDGRGRTRANYRGDLTVELPAGQLGGAQATAVGHLRFGQGEGLALRPTHTSTANTVPFQTSAGPDDSFGILAQGYLNLEWSLRGGGLNEQKGDRVELTLGKMDVFGFFDQNAVAGDEGAQFLNNAFVHNPLLDSGGDIAADAYGFAPGLRLAYIGVGDGSSQWGASLGLFAAGAGANWSGGLGRPLAIAQIEWAPLQINGEPRGNYRLYAWTNGRTTGLDGNTQRHTGVGLSVDQRLGRDWNLFGRAGRRVSGDGAFNSALTLGFEHGGRAWGRGRDAMGLAVGWLKTSAAWKAATADGTLAGYAASGQERIAELYYRLRLNEHLELSPDFQIIQRPGGDGTAKSLRAWGVRATAGF